MISISVLSVVIIRSISRQLKLYIHQPDDLQIEIAKEFAYNDTEAMLIDEVTFRNSTKANYF
jgi:hypothetical protein